MTDKIKPPNYTQIPNDVLGDLLKKNTVKPGLMAILEGSQLKVLLAVCRLTFGFHQTERRASLTMIEKMTGLSRQGVINAAGKLEEMGLIERIQDGGLTLWRILVKSVDYPEVPEVVNSIDQGVNSVDQGSQLSRPPSKKETRNKPEKESRPPTKPAYGIYIKVTGNHGLKKTWIDKMHKTVGVLDEDLALWENIITNWTGFGWKVDNIIGMLDYYNRREIPGQQPNGHNGHAQQQSKVAVVDPDTGEEETIDW